MNTLINNKTSCGSILSILNHNIIDAEDQKDAMETMGISACQVACMSYKCCTGHGSGGKHIQHSYKIKQ